MIPSPCNNVCTIGAGGVCLGCRRTLDEIAAWPTANDEGKRAILAAIAERPLRPRR